MKVESESEVAQLCPTLSDPVDCSLPGSSIHGIFQATVLEWGTIAFSRGKTRRKQSHYEMCKILTSILMCPPRPHTHTLLLLLLLLLSHFSHVRLCETP